MLSFKTSKFNELVIEVKRRVLRQLAEQEDQKVRKWVT